MFEELRRPLKNGEVECRIGAFKQFQGFTILLYKTARTDAKILDEVCDKNGWVWFDTFRLDANNNPVCRITIKGDFGSVFREDVGFNEGAIKKTKSKKTDDEGNSEEKVELVLNTLTVKGAYSDAFKRAGFKWGIGAELYDHPFIWVPCNDKYPPKVYDWKVKIANNERGYSEGFEILNDKHQQIFAYKVPVREMLITNKEKEVPSNIVLQLEFSKNLRNKAKEGFDAMIKFAKDQYYVDFGSNDVVFNILQSGDPHTKDGQNLIFAEIEKYYNKNIK